MNNVIGGNIRMKTKIQILLLILSSFYIFGVTLPSNIALKTNIDLLEQPTD